MTKREERRKKYRVWKGGGKKVSSKRLEVIVRRESVEGRSGEGRTWPGNGTWLVALSYLQESFQLPRVCCTSPTRLVFKWYSTPITLSRPCSSLDRDEERRKEERGGEKKKETKKLGRVFNSRSACISRKVGI